MIMLALAAATLVCAGCATSTTPDQTGAAQPVGPQSPSKMKHAKTTPG